MILLTLYGVFKVYCRWLTRESSKRFRHRFRDDLQTSLNRSLNYDGLDVTFSYTDWLHEPRDPHCNTQLQISLLKWHDLMRLRYVSAMSDVWKISHLVHYTELINAGAEGVSVIFFPALIFCFDLLRVIYGLFIMDGQLTCSSIKIRWET